MPFFAALAPTLGMILGLALGRPINIFMLRWAVATFLILQLHWKDSLDNAEEEEEGAQINRTAVKSMTNLVGCGRSYISFQLREITASCSFAKSFLV